MATTEFIRRAIAMALSSLALAYLLKPSVKLHQAAGIGLLCMVVLIFLWRFFALLWQRRRSRG